MKKALIVLAAALVAGCCSSPYREAAYGPGPEAPPVISQDAGALPPEGANVMAAPLGQEKTFVERHPILSSPVNYYRDSGDNPVVKVLAGTFVGIPVGVAREAWQIVYGQ